MLLAIAWIFVVGCIFFMLWLIFLPERLLMKFFGR